MTYPLTEVFLLCFSLGSTTSFENIEQKWYPEIRHHCPDIPTILVGTKMDLRDDNETVKSENSVKRPAFVSYGEGLAMAGKIGAVKYVECSAKTQKGLISVFNEAVQAAMIPPKKKKSRQCHLL